MRRFWRRALISIAAVVVVVAAAGWAVVSNGRFITSFEQDYDFAYARQVIVALPPGGHVGFVDMMRTFAGRHGLSFWAARYVGYENLAMDDVRLTDQHLAIWAQGYVKDDDLFDVDFRPSKKDPADTVEIDALVADLRTTVAGLPVAFVWDGRKPLSGEERTFLAGLSRPGVSGAAMFDQVADFARSHGFRALPAAYGDTALFRNDVIIDVEPDLALSSFAGDIIKADTGRKYWVTVYPTAAGIAPAALDKLIGDLRQAVARASGATLAEADWRDSNHVLQTFTVRLAEGTRDQFMAEMKRFTDAHGFDWMVNRTSASGPEVAAIEITGPNAVIGAVNDDQRYLDQFRTVIYPTLYHPIAPEALAALVAEFRAAVANIPGAAVVDGEPGP